jgi:Tfp pilus assembly protein PilV
MNMVSKKVSGFALAEVVIAAAIIGSGLLAILGAYSFFVRAEKSNTDRVKAVFLLEEGIEAARYLRDKGWTANIASLSTTSSYYFYLSTSSGTGMWQTTTTPQVYDGVFTRTVTFGQVYRDNTTQNISTTSSGATIDSNTRKISVSISWRDSLGSTTKSMSAYLTDLNNN